MSFVKKAALSALLVSSSEAFSLPSFNIPDASVLTGSVPLMARKNGGKANGCPPVWKNVVSDLSAMFLDTSTGQCTDDARAAIRESGFHWPGLDFI